jgi:hypothetical protein
LSIVPELVTKAANAPGFRQSQTNGSIRTIRPHGPIGERRITDREVEIRRQFGSRKISDDDARPRLQ